MTIHQLRCFVAVANHLSYARAAEQLFLSQPAVTHHIQALESELGTQLFFRSRQKVTLTAAGTNFLIDATDILDRMEVAARRALDNPNSETLSIGIINMQLPHLPEIYRQYHACSPEVLINNTEITFRDCKKMLAEGMLDLVFSPYSAELETSGLTYRTLHRGAYYCVIPKGHRFETYEMVTEQDLAGEILILLDTAHCPPEMDQVQYQLRKKCLHASFYYSGSSLYTIPMIEAGLGIAVMPDFVCPQTKALSKIPFVCQGRVEYGIAYHSNDRSKKVRNFIQTVTSVYSIETA
jgi:DNA-binding transcriptional LysR family regulator